MSQTPIEYRLIDLDALSLVEETREDGSQARSISGYAAVFEKLSVDFGGFKEKIARGAFTESMQRDVVALWSHNTDIVLGRSSNQTLSLEEDNTGLKFRLSLDDDHWGQYAYKKIKRRDVKGMSFGFRMLPKGEEWSSNEKKEYIRTLTKLELIEISPTAFPAYPATSAQARSFEVRSYEDILKSGKQALGDLQSDLSIYHRGQRLRLIEAC